jgi:uncharacterized NAD-dependent epimerase/dehydratase family protein
MLQPHHRVAILLHGGVRTGDGKTGLAMLRYRQGLIVAVIDQDAPGESLLAHTGIQRSSPDDPAKEVPVVASVQAALAYRPDALVIGVAPSGGKLPADWAAEVQGAIAAGVSIVNGLHTPLGKDRQVQASLQPGQWIWDIRQEPEGIPIGGGAARDLACRRVLTVGSDMAVGKMSASLTLNQAAQAQGLNSRFVGTGQAGIMISGSGIPLDAVRVDFACGAVEQAVLAAGQEAELLFVEGQGSLLHPGSTATLPLMRGSQPTHLILVHRAGQTQIRRFEQVTIPPLPQVIALYEAVAAAGGAYAPAKVVGIALNTGHLTAVEAERAIAQTAAETGLPCADVVRQGGTTLLQAILQG